MSTRRLARLNEQMKREISEILRSHVRDPRIGHPTVTGVAVTPDLWLARVYVRADPSLPADNGEDLLTGLGAAAPFIRRELGKSMRLRRVPELRFMADETLEHALRIERILREVLPEGGESDEGEEDAGGLDDGDTGDGDAGDRDAGEGDAGDGDAGDRDAGDRDTGDGDAADAEAEGSSGE